MRKISSIPQQSRPREKLLHRGVEALTDVELWCVLLLTGSRSVSVTTLAERVVRHLKQHEGRIDLPTLTQLGVTPSKSAQILAHLELAQRRQSSSRVSVSTPEQVYAHAHDIALADREYVLCLYLNARGELIKKEQIAVGTLNTAQLLPREIFHVVKDLPVASIILVHNHPSGSLEISDADVAFTQRVREAGDILGVTLLDHLIVTSTGWVQIDSVLS